MAVMEHDHEPVRGLPGMLPEGEQILWQGSPDRRVFLRRALRARWIGAYFGILTLWAIASGSLLGAAMTALSGIVLFGLLALFAHMVARTSVYTITNRRVVLRIGVALSKCINLPLSAIGAADLRQLDAGHGDIALTLNAAHRLGYAMLWPHARPFKLSRPQPMLRAVADAEAAAKVLARACNRAAMPQPERAAPVGRMPRPQLEEAAA